MKKKVKTRFGNQTEMDSAEGVEVAKAHPIDSLTWIHVDKLTANDYNPNCVFDPEMNLLKLSLLSQGWIQPILADKTAGQDGKHQIIDGFHRWSLASQDADVRAFTAGKVPVALLELTRAERIMLTVRINRAKGTHIAFDMAELVQELFYDLEIPEGDIARQTGASKKEIEVLLHRDVFEAKNTRRRKYSRAWTSKNNTPIIDGEVDLSVTDRDKTREAEEKAALRAEVNANFEKNKKN